MLAEFVVRRFKELDVSKAGRLCADDLRSQVQSRGHDDSNAMETRISRAIEALNESLPQLRCKSCSMDDLSFPGYKYVVTTERFDDSLSHEVTQTLTDIREACLKDSTAAIIAD